MLGPFVTFHLLMPFNNMHFSLLCSSDGLPLLKIWLDSINLEVMAISKETHCKYFAFLYFFVYNMCLDIGNKQRIIKLCNGICLPLQA